MAKMQVQTNKVWSSPNFSQAIVVEQRGRLVFVAGMTARDPDGNVVGVGDPEAQTRQVLENIKRTLAEVGGSMEHVCRLDIYLTDIKYRSITHRLRREYFPPPLPTATQVEVSKLAHPDYLVEITAIAVIPHE